MPFEQLRICRWIESLLAGRGLRRDWIRRQVLVIPQLELYLKSKPEGRAKMRLAWPQALRVELLPYLEANLWERSPSNYFSFLHPLFPKRLHQIADPPCGLYFRGDPSVLRKGRPWIGVVGTRRASAYAMETCRALIREMLPYQPVIVSGMASGIDAAAHAAALDFGLASIGILGTPVDRVYPRSNAPLFARMREKGLLLSELPSNAELAAWRFPERNRLIAALSEALLVVEAPRPSGALLTADFALDLGREIFVLPGTIGEHNAGGHRLIQQGAHLITEAAEMFRRLGCRKKIPGGQTSEPVASVQSWTPEEASVLRALQGGVAQIDKIAQVSQLAQPLLAVTLSSLLLADVICERPGKMFEINKDYKCLADSRPSV